MQSATKPAGVYAKKISPKHTEQIRIEATLNQLITPLISTYCVSGFSHPDLLTYNHDPAEICVRQWGLIPSWVRDHKEASLIQNQTLNARFETIFIKSSFKYSAQYQRCIILADGFFEFHHLENLRIPYYVRSLDESPMLMAALYDAWIDPFTGREIQSTTVVTTKANAHMSRIHNNPNAKEARMPLLLSDETASIWLNTQTDTSALAACVQAAQDFKFHTHTVAPIQGKHAMGNRPEAIIAHVWAEQQRLF